MPQHDLVLDNGSGAAFRADANNALAALGSTMKGPNAPPAPIAGMMWLDDDTPSASVWTLKLYDGADWISIATFDISANTWAPVITRLALGAGSAGVPALTLGDADTGFYGPSAGQLAVATNGVERALINENGNLVIGGATALHRFNAINSGIGGGAPASSGSAADPNACSRFGAGSVVLDVGATLSGAMWLQVRSAGNYATNYPLSLNPNGGGVNMVGPVNVSSGDLDVAGNLRFNSGYGSAALAYGVRAWVNFNGTGTVAIRGSGGVTSITDNATGDYTVNLNFTMPDTNYSAVGNAGPDFATISAGVFYAPVRTTTSVRVITSDNNTDALFDYARVDLHIVR